MADVFIVCADGLKGIAVAIEAVWPAAVHQTCVRAAPGNPDSYLKVLYLVTKEKNSKGGNITGRQR